MNNIKNNFRHALVSLHSYLIRDLQINLSYRIQFIFSLFSIFLSIYIFFFFSKLFQGQNTYLDEYGGDYFFFLIIGISLMDMIFRISITLNLEVRNYQLTGIFDELLNMPSPIIYTLLSSHIYPIFLSIMRSFLYLAVATLFFGLEINLNYPILITISLILTIISFLGIGLIAGAYAIVFKRGNPLSSLNRISVMFIGGVFFPTSVLPEWLEKISFFIPITHSLDLLRALLTPYDLSTELIFEKILILLAFATILLFSGVFLCMKAIEFGKKRGTLNFY